ncbi:hypothetical protein H8959_018597 [Pygathrix nigripes]
MQKEEKFPAMQCDTQTALEAQDISMGLWKTFKLEVSCLSMEKPWWQQAFSARPTPIPCLNQRTTEADLARWTLWEDYCWKWPGLPCSDHVILGRIKGISCICQMIFKKSVFTARHTGSLLSDSLPGLRYPVNTCNSEYPLTQQ